MLDKSLFELDGVRGFLFAQAALSFVKALLVIAQAVILSRLLVTLFEGSFVGIRTPDLVLLMLSLILARGISTLQESYSDKFARKQADSLSEELLGVAFSDRSSIAGRLGTAGIVTTALEGIDEAERYLRTVVPEIVSCTIIPFSLLIYIFSADWVSGVILAAMFPVIILFMVLIGRSASAQATIQYNRFNEMANNFVDTVRGMTTIKALGAGLRASSEVFDSSEKLRKATNRTLKLAMLSGALLDLIGTFGVAGVAMMLAFRLLDGTLAYAVAISVLYLSPEYFKPIRAFALDFHASQDGRNALASINETLELARKGIGDMRSHDTIKPFSWNESSTLELIDASFTYPNAELPAFEHVNLSIHGYEKAALIGSSGSGKSTLATILAGFGTLSSGEIRLDGAPVSSLECRAWRDQVLYIPQSPYIFNASLRKNIAFYTPDATDGQILDAIDAVGLNDLLSELPSGLDTVVGHDGRGLSGGERHRVALARAFLDRSRRVLVFDEPTAHLDIQTELELKQTMLEIMEGRLVIFATHRLHWLDSMDKVLDLDEEDVGGELYG